MVLDCLHQNLSETEKILVSSCSSKHLNYKISIVIVGLEKQVNQEEDESSNDNEQASAALRIRKTQHATTVHMLVEALAEFNAEQIDYKEKCEDRMQKVVSIGKTIFFFFTSKSFILTHLYLISFSQSRSIQRSIR